MIDLGGIQKWNFNTHKYEPYSIPEDKKVILYSEDMKQKVNCASCFKVVTYGNTLTSLTIHTNIGLGFPVCDECYNLEWDGKQRSEK